MCDAHGGGLLLRTSERSARSGGVDGGHGSDIMYDDAIIFWAYMNDARLVNTINVLLLMMYDDAFIFWA